MNDLAKIYLSNAISCAAIANHPFETTCFVSDLMVSHERYKRQHPEDTLAKEL